MKLFQIQMTWHPLGSKTWVFLRHVIKFWNTVHPQIPDCSANSFSVQCLSPSIHCLVMATDMAVWKGWTLPLWCMSEVNILQFWMSISTLELFNMAADYHSVLHAALYGTSTHFCCTELPFLYMNTAPFYGFHLWMRSLNTFAHKIHVHSCTYTPIYWYQLQIHLHAFTLTYSNILTNKCTK
jgi:hypothetical protein